MVVQLHYLWGEMSAMIRDFVFIAFHSINAKHWTTQVITVESR